MCDDFDETTTGFAQLLLDMTLSIYRDGEALV